MRGSATRQCNRLSGACVCLESYGGAKCNECARGYTGTWPACEPCGECFQNWDKTLTELKNKTNTLVDQANNIEDTGVASVYDDQFKKMEAMLGEVKRLLDRANVTGDDVTQLQALIDKLKTKIDGVKEKLNRVDESITVSTAGVDAAETALKEFKEQAAGVAAHADALKENATRLKGTRPQYCRILMRMLQRRMSRAHTISLVNQPNDRRRLSDVQPPQRVLWQQARNNDAKHKACWKNTNRISTNNLKLTKSPWRS
jgi:chromosome segregation ATPase